MISSKNEGKKIISIEVIFLAFVFYVIDLGPGCMLMLIVAF